MCHTGQRRARGFHQFMTGFTLLMGNEPKTTTFLRVFRAVQALDMYTLFHKLPSPVPAAGFLPGEPTILHLSVHLCTLAIEVHSAHFRAQHRVQDSPSEVHL